MNNKDPTKKNKSVVNPCVREGYTVHISYKTPIVYLYYIQLSNACIVSSCNSFKDRKTN